MDETTYKLPESINRFRIGFWVGIALLCLSLIGFFIDRQQFFFSYLTAFVFWLTIALGGLFFTLLHHLFGAKWSVSVRRIYETLAVLLPFLALFILPVILGVKDLYHWSIPQEIAHDHLLQQKTAFLNIPFFIIRAVVYVSVWIGLTRLFYKASLDQDIEFSSHRADRLRSWSAPAMIAFALTFTFAGFDWVMSLDAHWYSTIFGVYLFGGAASGTLSFVILFVLYLRRETSLRSVLSFKRLNDLGRLLFVFTVFWAYIAFSQYFLIWYANIPEETIWYSHRWEGTWQTISLLLVVGHFLIPFIFLMPEKTKKNSIVLLSMSCLILLTHWFDLYWLIQPSLHHHSAHLSWMDLTCTLGLGGVFIGLFVVQISKHAVFPLSEPGLVEDNEIH